jgi:BASS family bile acid:Na+ symporter
MNILHIIQDMNIGGAQRVLYNIAKSCLPTSLPVCSIPTDNSVTPQLSFECCIHSTLLSPFMTPLLVSLLASGTHISIKALPMFVSIVETVILPVAVGFLFNYLFGKKKIFAEIQKIMPGIAVLGLACVVGGVISSQGSKFFQSGIVIFVAVLLHNGFGYFLGYCAGKLTGMNTAKKRTISIEVGMQNAGLATNLATTTAQFASTPESAIICAVSCVWHSISGTLLAGMFAQYDKIKSGHKETATAK